jgi:glycosyltransferase involved in cell wall biosynthesis
MLFSVVIPTHNRLHLLRDAVETVRRQKGGPWELVVFDNASSDPISDYVDSLNDERVKYYRSNDFLPVTDSWNRAINSASGDYIIFLGDDDGLTPDFFVKIKKLIDDFKSPEIIYSAIYQFLHPGVAPWEPGGYVADVKNGFFFADLKSPFRLSASDAKRAVVGSLHLRRNFTFNIQAFVFNRDFVTRICHDGPFFRSPFPDYYLANIALSLARSVVIVPEPLAIAGVSKASYGFTLFNGLEQQGEALLNSKLGTDPIFLALESRLLPGPAYQTNYVVTMEYVARATRSTFGEHVDFGRYRRLQILSVLRAAQMGLPLGNAWPEMRGRLKVSERVWAIFVASLLYLGKRSAFIEKHVVGRMQGTVGPYAFQPTPRVCDRGHFSRAIELYEAIESGALGRAEAKLAQI